MTSVENEITNNDEIKEEDIDVFDSPTIRDRINSLQKQNKFRKSRSFKRGESVTSILMNSYQPTIITDKRRKIEDFCRDLVVNNDHIHCVQQRMRVAIEQVIEQAMKCLKCL